MDIASVEDLSIGPACPFQSAGDSVEYPVEFELRIIYKRDGEASIVADVEAAIVRAGVLVKGSSDPSPAGERWGRLGCKVNVKDKTSMDALYAEVSKLPAVKAAI
ncbi:hypothetical protein MASR2M78_36590 [Treponema sp.]